MCCTVQKIGSKQYKGKKQVPLTLKNPGPKWDNDGITGTQYM